MLPEPAESLLQAVTDSARVASGRYIAFLGTAAFVFMVVAGTTHLQLLLGDRPIKLPLFGIDVSLKGFYGLAPWLLLILHLNLLVQCRLLSDKVNHFQKKIAQLNTLDQRDARNRLPNFPLVQMLACSEIQTPGIHNLITFIFWLSLISAPMIVLASIQVGFLPYHGEFYTWNHRIVLLIDAAALLFLWRSIYEASNWNKAWLYTNTIATIIFSFLATIPDGRLESKIYNHLPKIPFLARGDDSQFKKSMLLTEWLFTYTGLNRNLDIQGKFNPIVGGEIDVTIRNALISKDNEKIQEILSTLPNLDLSNRNFKYANFDSSTLVAANFKESSLKGANLIGADLQGANLELAGAQGANLVVADLQGANLKYAQLQGAYLGGAQLQSSDLREAWLRGANLRGAQLQGTDLRWAKLQDADLVLAELQGADLEQAQLQGANFVGAQFQGADLKNAQLQRAYLGGANLKGSNLEMADLSHADIRMVELGPLTEKELSKLIQKLKAKGIRSELIADIEKRIRSPQFTGDIKSAKKTQ